MLNLNQTIEGFILQKLSLNAFRSGVHTVSVDGNNHRHFVELMWIAEFHYFEFPCYLSVVHSVLNKESKQAKCLLFIPQYHQKFFLIDITHIDDKVQKSLTCTNLVSLRNRTPSINRINLEIYTVDIFSFLSLDISTSDTSLMSIKTEILNLMNWIESEVKDHSLQKYLQTRTYHGL